MARDKLVVFESQGVYRIGWYLWEDDDMGATLGEDLSLIKLIEKNLDNKEVDKDHVSVTRALMGLEGVQKDDGGFYWESKGEATKALKLAKVAARGVVGEYPEWAKKAILEGWKAPRGWKPS